MSFDPLHLDFRNFGNGSHLIRRLLALGLDPMVVSLFCSRHVSHTSKFQRGLKSCPPFLYVRLLCVNVHRSASFSANAVRLQGGDFGQCRRDCFAQRFDHHINPLSKRHVHLGCWRGCVCCLASLNMDNVVGDFASVTF